nr:hypothetical protein [Candidatus Sigynarchaeum springense]
MPTTAAPPKTTISVKSNGKAGSKIVMMTVSRPSYPSVVLNSAV